MLEGGGGGTLNGMVKEDLFETVTSELTLSDKKGQDTQSGGRAFLAEGVVSTEPPEGTGTWFF